MLAGVVAVTLLVGGCAQADPSVVAYVGTSRITQQQLDDAVEGVSSILQEGERVSSAAVVNALIHGLIAEKIARIAVFSSGAVQLDGRPTTLPALDAELGKLKADKGVVWYHRENPASEPPPQGTAVIQLIIKHQLPVSMSTKPDFSDYVDEKGVSRPRSR